MHTVEVASGNVEVARLGCACADGIGVESLGKIEDVDVGIHLKSYAFCLHHIDAAVYDGFVELEIGNAEAEQSSNSLAAFEHGDVVAAAVQLVGCCQSGGTAAHYRHFFAVALILPRHHISFAECCLGNCALVFADGGRSVDGKFKYTALLAQGRAYASGEFRKIVGQRQYFISLVPVASVDGVLKFRRAVAKRTCPVAERHAAVHAAGCLQAAFGCVEGLFHFSEVADTVVDGAIARLLAWYGKKSLRITHICCFVLSVGKIS